MLQDVHAFGLAILGSQLYWTDKRKRALLRADKETGDHQTVLEEGLEIPMAIAALSREKRQGKETSLKRQVEHIALTPSRIYIKIS